METAPDVAELMIAEHDAIESWEEFEEPPTGAAILVQQAQEPFRNILRRAQLRARDLRVSGYRLNSMSYLLGPCDAGRFERRLAVAQGMLSILPEREATLHLVITDGFDQVTPMALVDHLRLVHPGSSIQVHFKRSSFLAGAKRRPAKARPSVPWIAIGAVAKPAFNAQVRSMEVVS